MGTLFSKHCFYEANLCIMMTFQLRWPNLNERASDSPTQAHAHKKSYSIKPFFLIYAVGLWVLRPLLA
jgi:hypothetical protein